jgi:hypothetical protein
MRMWLQTLEFTRPKGYHMSDETAIGPAGTLDGGGPSRRSRGQPAPLQSRAKFLENWNWSSVTQINGGLCERGRAQRGINKETHAAAAEECIGTNPKFDSTLSGLMGILVVFRPG